MALEVLVADRVEDLAGRLAGRLAGWRGATAEGFLTPLILTPNLYLQKWLRRALADAARVEMGGLYGFLEAGCWDLLKRLDPENPRPGSERDWPGMPERLTRESLQWMILAALSGERLPAEVLAPVHAYLESSTPAWGDPLVARKAWQLTHTLAGLFLEYEQLLPGWLDGRPTVRSTAESRLQIALYRALFGRGGIRALTPAGLAPLLTPPQYYRRVLHRDGLAAAPKALAAGGVPAIALFGATTLRPWQAEFFARLGEGVSVEVYHLRQREAPAATDPDALATILARWGRVERETLTLWRDQPGVVVTELAPAPPRRPSRLVTLQRTLAGAPPGANMKEPATPESLTIQAAPSVRREVEAVRDAIVRRLLETPDLRPDEIGVLVTDMSLYKPVIESVFDEGWLGLRINIVDAVADQESLYAVALKGLLALRSGRWGRSEILALADNPCFRAGVRLTSEDAARWHHWAEALHIHQGLSGAARGESLYATRETDADAPPRPAMATSERFTWAQGLRRLRLGRILATEGECETPLAWRDELPYADGESRDGEAVGRFSRVLADLESTLAAWPAEARASEWGARLRSLLERFLGVPEEHPLEQGVAESLARTLTPDALARLDGFFGGGRIPFALMQLYLQQILGELSSRRGNYLAGGPTFAALRSGRPTPFRELFLLGLGQGLFPGSAVTPPLDLCAGLTLLGSHDPVSLNEHAFLEALLSARERLTLSWVDRDLQSDKLFYPCSPLATVRTLLARIEGAAPGVRHLPLHGEAEQPLSPHEQLLALADRCREEGGSPEERERLMNRLLMQVDLAPGAASPLAALALNELPCRALSRYLEASSLAVMEVRYGMREDFVPEAGEDEVPLATAFPLDGRLRSEAVVAAITEILGARAARQELPPRPLASRALAAAYHRAAQRSATPEGVFGAADCERFEGEVVGMVAAVADFFAEPGEGWSGAVLGASPAPPKGALLLVPPRVGGLHLSGESGPLRFDGATLALLALAPFSDAERGLSRQLLAPLVLGAALLSTPRFSAAETLRIVTVGRGGLGERFDFPAAELPPWLAGVVGDLLSDTGESLVAFKPALDALKAGGEELLAPAFRARTEAELEAGRLRLPEHFALLEWGVPNDSAALLPRRYAPLLPLLEPKKERARG